MSHQPISFDGPVGQSQVRRTGRDKVRGAATFAAEWSIDGLLHAVAVPSTIAAGRVESFDTARAESMPGVRMVLTPDNAPPIKPIATMAESNFSSTLASRLLPASTREIHHAGQYVAAVIADTFENARDAALAVGINYRVDSHQTDIDAADADQRPQYLFGTDAVFETGDAEQAFASAAVKIESNFATAGNSHNAIEPHATIADWQSDDDGPRLTVRDATQGLVADKMTYARLFGIKADRVRVICPVIGGGFGGKGALWPHAILAVLCSQMVGRPVKVVCTRRQLYGGTGFRTPVRQTIRVAADNDGKIRSLIHTGHAATSTADVYDEAFMTPTRVLYDTGTLRLDQRRCRLNTQVPTFMRAPAEAPSMFAIESALDELAAALRMDPIALRIKNDASKTMDRGKPFSQRLLRECLQKGGEMFGWQSGHRECRGERQGDWLIGRGVATAMYPHFTFPTSAAVTLHDDGTVLIESCSQEMGTGTATAQSQVLADLIGVPATRVRMTLGDTALPPGGLSGGSSTTPSMGAALRDAADRLKNALVDLAKTHADFDNGIAASDARMRNGQLIAGEQSIALEDLLSAAMKPSVRVTGQFKPGQSEDAAHDSFGAQFVEVGVDEDFGLVRVRRMVGVFSCGKILNRRTARSQFIGGMIMGVGHALQEAIHWDHRYGRITNDNLAEYHVPVNADIPDIEVGWIDRPDFAASAIGAKGIGEIGITGVAAAIANAVYDATGRRVRTLPITPEQVMA